MTRDELRAALRHSNVQAFLHVIRAGEGTADDAGYGRFFGGSMFTDFSDHPRRAITAGRYTSTAAGAYQFLSRTWDGLVRQYGFADFGRESQDEAAVALIAGRKALADVIAGRIEAAIAKCAREWASLPGSPYGQPTRTLEQALATYAQHGGALEPVPEPPLVQLDQAVIPDRPAPPKDPEGVTMPPFLLAALPALIEAIPKLGKLFGSGEEVAERNVATVQTVAQIVQDATGARNIQEAVETIKADPAMAQAATAAIEARWYDLAESGGGGIEGARKADAEARAHGDLLQSPSLWVALALLPIVYLLVLSLIGVVGTATWSDDVRAGLSGSIISAIIGGLVGYYYGQTTSRNRQAAP